jgi:hypothetical protein
MLNDSAKMKPVCLDDDDEYNQDFNLLHVFLLITVVGVKMKVEAVKYQ